jgi:excisionase family DNA binding protein
MENNEVMKAREAARFLGYGYWKLLEDVKAGLIPHFRCGNRILFRKNTLLNWLEQQEKQSISGQG